MKFLKSCSYQVVCYRCLAAGKITKPQISTKLIDLESYTPDKIRNFAIVAHVDHGKSTLADRFLQMTNVIGKGEKAQFLDNLKVEQQRGITVKAVTCSMFYKGYLLNLIDTPGHVDFGFEVSRSLSACSGMILLVAANSGVQAQTITNFWLGFELDLKVLPVINKIDLPTAKVESVKAQLHSLFDFDPKEIRCISAKSNIGVSELLDALIEQIPSPNVDSSKPFRALIFDSYFEHFRGAIALILVKEGSVVVGQKIKSYNEQKEYEVTEVGMLYPDRVQTKKLSAGQVGYLICNMKTVKEACVGETLFSNELDQTDVTPFAKFTPNKPSIYAGFFPFNPSDYDDLKRALDRLALNDSSVTIQADSSSVLGLGFKLGFNGMLHMDVFAQRLDDEYDANVILTTPSVEYKCRIKDNDTIRKKRYQGQGEFHFKDPSQFPDIPDVEAFFEPMVLLTIISPVNVSSNVNKLCEEARGERVDSSLMNEEKILIKFRLPLGEVVSGFFDDLKRITSGYASFDYVMDDYRATSLVKLCVSINDKPIDEFSMICPEIISTKKAKFLVHKLKEQIPQQQYEVKIKATLGKSTKPICTAAIKPLKKDFAGTMKGNFGGAMDRLQKKLNHQQEGKEKMRSVGNIKIPKEAFVNVLRDNRFNN